MAKDNEIEIEEVGAVESSEASIEQFVEENQNIILGVIGVVVVAVGLYVGYKRMFVAPREAEAKNLVYQAQNWFAADSFRLALEGDGASYGFYDIIDEYKSTQVGEMAHYYAGISELNLGNYEEAVDYLSKFSTSDPNVQAKALGALGDAHAELDNLEKAAGQYKKAAESANITSIKTDYLFRAGKAYEILEDYNAAKTMYSKIVSELPEESGFNPNSTNQTILNNAKKSLAKVEALAD